MQAGPSVTKSAVVVRDLGVMMDAQLTMRDHYMKENFVVPRTCLKLEERAFSVAAPQAWNRLLTDLKTLRSTPAFETQKNYEITA